MYRPIPAAAIAAAALWPMAAAAQDHAMPGMAMPMTRPAPAVRPRPEPKPKPASASMAHGPPMKSAPHAHATPKGTTTMPDTSASPPQAAPHGPAAMPDMAMAAAMPGADPAAMAAMSMGMGGDAYSHGSGTARLPADEGTMRGKMFRAGDWTLMAAGYAWGVATDQGGARGRDEAFVESMAMLMADRDLGERLHLQLSGMTSLDPAMGARGYPNLFATGEVADGEPLVNRQHPHDLVMELSARADYRIGRGGVFVYAAPVGEPALGPSAFMHRGSARYLPLSPITHHWFDSTHITYGVVTAGYAAPAFQLEASAFRGREPDDHRWNIETPRLDSWSVRGTWTPSRHWAVQLSHGRLQSPEEADPHEDEARTTASVNYAAGGVTTTVAYAIKDRLPGRALTALLAEATWEIDRHHAVFGRVENVANDELFPDTASPLHDATVRVTRVEAGYAYRVPISGPFGVALGGTVAGYAKPAALDAAYGRHPVSGTVFAKFALGL